MLQSNKYVAQLDTPQCDWLCGMFNGKVC